MDTKALYQDALILEGLLSLVVLGVMAIRRALKVYPYVGVLLAVEFLSCMGSIALLFHREQLHISYDHGFQAVILTAWVSETLILILRILAVYCVFAEAMRPMAGLHQAGKIIFRWVGLVSVLVSFALVADPGVLTTMTGWGNVVSRLLQGVDVLTLCLLVFVCFAIRPLGLTLRSHLFGVSLGLGIASTADLVEAAWMVTRGAHSFYSPVIVGYSFGISLAFAVWAMYFAMPEPERRMILLPTTSPFFFWNRISEILGDAPGQVAIAGFSPKMLAPAEVEMLTAITSHDEAQRQVAMPLASFGLPLSTDVTAAPRILSGAA